MRTVQDRAQPVASLSFEEALQHLQEVVLQLEGGALTLDQTIATFRHGSELATHCQRLLAEAELRIIELSSPNDSVKPNDPV